MSIAALNSNHRASANEHIAQIIGRARAAQLVYQKFTQGQVDEAVTAAGWAIMQPERNRLLAEMAMRDTGFGVVEDKVVKNYRKTLGLLRDLKGARSVGVIAEYPDKGIVEIARPVGVVAAITPSTSPTATPASKIINALKGRNAIIISPSPKGLNTCATLVGFVNAELMKVGAPSDLVQYLPAPVTKVATLELMRQSDLVVATGSQNNVRAAYASGTPAFGVGVGNVCSIVDASADLQEAAINIARSKTFDNATSCASENSLIILNSVYEKTLMALSDAGGILLNGDEKSRLQTLMWSGSKLNHEVTAQSVQCIARLARLDLANPAKAKFLMVEESGIGANYPFSGEKLSPVLTVYRALNFAQACAIVEGIYSYQGAGHSVSIHSNDSEHILRLGLELPVCRVIVNQSPCFATGGNFDNGLPFSLSLGCGTWGRNNFSDNLNYMHYLNITRIVRKIPERIPTEQEIFGDYLLKFS
jgi:sulfoacetaldehyde dehydrogenase